MEEGIDNERETVPGADVGDSLYRMDTSMLEIQAAYDALLRTAMKAPGGEDADAAANADAAAIAAADAIIAVPRFREVVVQALRLGARSRHEGEPRTALLSDHPFRAARSADAADYDVFSWPLYTQKAPDKPAHPVCVTLPQMVYIAMLTMIRQEMVDSAQEAVAAAEEGSDARVKAEAALNDASKFCPTGYLSRDKSGENTYTLADFKTLFQVPSTTDLYSCDETNTELTYNRETDLSFAAEHPSAVVMEANETKLGGRLVAPRPTRHKPPSTALLHGVSSDALQGVRAEMELPHFYALPAKTTPDEQDLTLLPNQVCDFGLRLWVVLATEPGVLRPLDAVFWPELWQDDSAHSSFVASVPGSTTELRVLATKDGRSVFYLQGEDVGVLQHPIETETRVLRDLQRRRVATERAYDWYGMCYAASPWSVRDALPEEARRILTKDTNTPIDEVKTTGAVSTTLSVGNLMSLADFVNALELKSIARIIVGDVVSVRFGGEWAVSPEVESPYGVCEAMQARTNAWFVARCWETAPPNFIELVKKKLLVPHVKNLLQQKARLREQKRQLGCDRQIAFFAAGPSGTTITDWAGQAAEAQRTRTLVYQMAMRVTNDLRRHFKDHLSVDEVTVSLMMDARRNDFFTNFYTMVAFEVKLRASLSHLRALLASSSSSPLVDTRDPRDPLTPCSPRRSCTTAG